MLRPFQKVVFLTVIICCLLNLLLLNASVRAEPPAKRIVCASYDVIEMLRALGCSQQVVGKPKGCLYPEFSHAEAIGGFGDIDIQRIVQLSPDLVITYSDIQADLVGKLAKHHLTVLALNHHNIQGIYDSLLLLGTVLGREHRAEQVIRDMQSKIKAYIGSAPPKPQRLTVYFEEYDSPYITGAEWVSEMIEIAGGINVNKELSGFKSAKQRVVSTEMMIKKDPDIIIAVWCGKPFDKDKIASREGWDRIRAVQNNKIYTMPHEIVLQPSQRIVEGIAYLQALFKNHTAGKTTP
jgi:iron complex transport system substrate-binding protein